MCCLKYEQESYERLIANSVNESYVKTSDGKGTVVDVIFQRHRKVRIEGDNDLSNEDLQKQSDRYPESGKKGLCWKSSNLCRDG